MGTYNTAEFTKKIFESHLKLFTLKNLKDLLGVQKKQSLFAVVKRLSSGRVLSKIEKNKYMLKDAFVHDFSFANFLYQLFSSNNCAS